MKKSPVQKSSSRTASFLLFFLLALLIFASSCTRITQAPPSSVQTGLASWYGPDFHGKLTSNKEIYDMYDMTAAHKSLPFGTHVMVTNLENGKSIIVRINDRGPFVKGRIIDLSYGAAEMLDMVGAGVVHVRIEILENLSPKPGTRKFSVQVGSFIVKENATKLKGLLGRKMKNVYLSEYKTPSDTYYRVRIKARTLKEAEAIAIRLQEQGYTVLVLEEQ